MAHREILCDFLHVLMGEQIAEAGLICTGSHRDITSFYIHIIKDLNDLHNAEKVRDEQTSWGKRERERILRFSPMSW